jgi:uncharacterized membrane protein YfcA
VATSLVIVGANALTGAWLHRREGHVRLKQALLFGAYGLLAAYAGARLSRLLSDALLLVLFALLMLTVALLMLRGGARKGKRVGQVQRSSRWRILLGGGGVGFLTGFLGVGGGFLIVPALVLLLGMEMADAVGSSLVVISLNSAAGLLGHLSSGSLPWGLIGVFVVAGLAGLWLGARFARRIPAARLRQAFAYFIVALAVVLLAINVPAILYA